MAKIIKGLEITLPKTEFTIEDNEKVIDKFYSITEDTIQKLAENYNYNFRQAYFTLGHPNFTQPEEKSLGYFKKLYTDKKKINDKDYLVLKGDLVLNNIGYELVKNKHVINQSVCFYKDAQELDGKLYGKEGYYVLHVAGLGSSNPAVPYLKPIKDMVIEDYNEEVNNYSLKRYSLKNAIIYKQKINEEGEYMFRKKKISKDLTEDKADDLQDAVEDSNLSDEEQNLLQDLIEDAVEKKMSESEKRIVKQITNLLEKKYSLEDDDNNKDIEEDDDDKIEKSEDEDIDDKDIEDDDKTEKSLKKYSKLKRELQKVKRRNRDLEEQNLRYSNTISHTTNYANNTVNRFYNDQNKKIKSFNINY